MPRPKIPGTAETIQTFNCGYALKLGLLRGAELADHANPSSFIRAELEQSCRRHLGDKPWDELVRVSQDSGRMTSLEKHLAQWDTRRIRTQFEARKAGGKIPEIEMAQVTAAMESYWRDLVSERDRTDLPLPLRLVLLEAADIVYKVSRPFRGKLSAKTISDILVSVRHLPPSLRGDFEAAAVALSPVKTGKG